MISVDGPAVAVALPGIKADLHLSDASLSWILNSYLIAYAGVLPLSGRLSDLFGPRRVLLLAFASFTIASVGCGIASSWEQLVGARGAQGLAGAAFTLFLGIESRVRDPLVPLRMFRIRSFAICCIARTMVSAALASGVIASLYLQRVLGYGALEASLTFLPSTLATGVGLLGASKRLVARLGQKCSLTLGLCVTLSGLVLLAAAPIQGSATFEVLPALILLGVGPAIVFSPLYIVATTAMSRSNSALISGVINTLSVMGGVLGLAVLAAVADMRTSRLLSSGTDLRAALNSGYHLAFSTGAIFIIGSMVAVALLRSDRKSLETPRE